MNCHSCHDINMTCNNRTNICSNRCGNVAVQEGIYGQFHGHSLPREARYAGCENHYDRDSCLVHQGANRHGYMKTSDEYADETAMMPINISITLIVPSSRHVQSVISCNNIVSNVAEWGAPFYDVNNSSPVSESSASDSDHWSSVKVDLNPTFYNTRTSVDSPILIEFMEAFLNDLTQYGLFEWHPYDFVYLRECRMGPDVNYSIVAPATSRYELLRTAVSGSVSVTIQPVILGATPGRSIGVSNNRYVYPLDVSSKGRLGRVSFTDESSPTNSYPKGANSPPPRVSCSPIVKSSRKRVQFERRKATGNRDRIASYDAGETQQVMAKRHKSESSSMEISSNDTSVDSADVISITTDNSNRSSSSSGDEKVEKVISHYIESSESESAYVEETIQSLFEECNVRPALAKMFRVWLQDRLVGDTSGDREFVLDRPSLLVDEPEEDVCESDSSESDGCDVMNEIRRKLQGRPALATMFRSWVQDKMDAGCDIDNIGPDVLGGFSEENDEDEMGEDSSSSSSSLEEGEVVQKVEAGIDARPALAVMFRTWLKDRLENDISMSVMDENQGGILSQDDDMEVDQDDVSSRVGYRECDSLSVDSDFDVSSAINEVKDTIKGRPTLALMFRSWLEEKSRVEGETGKSIIDQCKAIVSVPVDTSHDDEDPYSSESSDEDSESLEMSGKELSSRPSLAVMFRSWLLDKIEEADGSNLIIDGADSGVLSHNPSAGSSEEEQSSDDPGYIEGVGHVDLLDNSDLEESKAESSSDSSNSSEIDSSTEADDLDEVILPHVDETDRVLIQTNRKPICIDDGSGVEVPFAMLSQLKYAVNRKWIDTQIVVEYKDKDVVKILVKIVKIPIPEGIAGAEDIRSSQKGCIGVLEVVEGELGVFEWAQETSYIPLDAIQGAKILDGDLDAFKLPGDVTIGDNKIVMTEPKRRRLSRQLCFYFNEVNFEKDTYLKSLRDVEGWIPVWKLQEFSKIKKENISDAALFNILDSLDSLETKFCPYMGYHIRPANEVLIMYGKNCSIHDVEVEKENIAQ